MFIINWIFDKLGYVPKIDVEVGKVDLQFEAWPFPAEEKKPVPKTKPKVAKKPAVKRPSTRKPKTK